MVKHARQQLPALACAAALLAVIVVAHPVGEVPVSDDVSFLFSAQVLAKTGHIAYNGFVSPMLGWQLYWGALFLRLFGDTFHVARLSISCLALSAAYLCQRTMVRAGVTAWNAMVATLTLVLSPMFATVSTSFLTDVPALIAILVCLYSCLRTLQARTTAGAIGWLGFAALSNVVLGSVRQTAWMGALVMVPSVLWLVRRRAGVLRAGTGFLAIGVVLIAAMLHWFSQQPYTMVESVLPPAFTPHFFLQMSLSTVKMVLEMGLFLLPVLVVFLPALLRRGQPRLVLVVAVVVAICAVLLARSGHLLQWAAPYLGATFLWPFDPRVSLLLTFAVVVCLLGLLSSLLKAGEPRPEVAAAVDSVDERKVSFAELLVLTVPAGVASAALLVVRSGFTAFWDRYTLPLLFLALLLLMRFYQARSFSWGQRRGVSVVALLLALVYGGYAAALVHDDYVWRRAMQAASEEVEASGIARTEITGGWDYDELTELRIAGHVYAPRMRLPKGEVPPPSTHYGLPNCQGFFCDMFPHVLPKYALSPQAEAGFREFPPVSYRRWLMPSGSIYVVPFR
jgi:hypothetical protein